MSQEGSPTSWDLEQLQQRWQACLENMIREKVVNFPLKRLRFQAEQDPEFKRVVEGWPELSGEEREEGWGSLMQVSQRAAGELLPICVACGDCCRKGSPSLHEDDLDLVMQQKLPWSKLTTLRRGEMVRSPFALKPYTLEEERIKLSERSLSHACFFFDPEAAACRVYRDRPLECRAQACWDPSQSEDAFQEAYLTREKVFGGVPGLWELIQEHEQRCGFAAMRASFEAIEGGAASQADTIVEMLAFDEHVREFVCERFDVPEDNLSFLFGRSLTSQVELFGFRVDRSSDGIRTLRLIEETGDSAQA